MTETKEIEALGIVVVNNERGTEVNRRNRQCTKSKEIESNKNNCLPPINFDIHKSRAKTQCPYVFSAFARYSARSIEKWLDFRKENKDRDENKRNS